MIVCQLFLERKYLVFDFLFYIRRVNFKFNYTQIYRFRLHCRATRPRPPLAKPIGQSGRPVLSLTIKSIRNGRRREALWFVPTSAANRLSETMVQCRGDEWKKVMCQILLAKIVLTLTSIVFLPQKHSTLCAILRSVLMIVENKRLLALTRWFSVRLNDRRQFKNSLILQHRRSDKLYEVAGASGCFRKPKLFWSVLLWEQEEEDFVSTSRILTINQRI